MHLLGYFDIPTVSGVGCGRSTVFKKNVCIPTAGGACPTSTLALGLAPLSALGFGLETFLELLALGCAGSVALSERALQSFEELFEALPLFAFSERYSEVAPPLSFPFALPYPVPGIGGSALSLRRCTVFHVFVEPSLLPLVAVGIGTLREGEKRTVHFWKTFLGKVGKQFLHPPPNTTAIKTTAGCSSNFQKYTLKRDPWMFAHLCTHPVQCGYFTGQATEMSQYGSNEAMPANLKLLVQAVTAIISQRITIKRDLPVLPHLKSFLLDLWQKFQVNKMHTSAERVLMLLTYLAVRREPYPNPLMPLRQSTSFICFPPPEGRLDSDVLRLQAAKYGQNR